jgi:hypothetical protein
MSRRLAFAIALAAAGTLTAPDVLACGDKFLLVGRGVRLQRSAYAAIHPARVLLVIPPRTVKYAAVRDPQLQDALKRAGHRVDAVQLPKLAETLARSRYDIVMAERADVAAVQALPVSGRKPSIIGIVDASAAGPAPRVALDAELKTPQPLPEILRVLDDVMKARIP